MSAQEYYTRIHNNIHLVLSSHYHQDAIERKKKQKLIMHIEKVRQLRKR